MEKVSNVIGQSKRVGSTDSKNAPPARAGGLATGRSVAEPVRHAHEAISSPRAMMLQQHMSEEKLIQSEVNSAKQMSAAFFGHPKAADKAETSEAPAKAVAEPVQPAVDPELRAQSARTDSMTHGDEDSVAMPSRYSPRGSYIDLRA